MQKPYPTKVGTKTTNEAFEPGHAVKVVLGVNVELSPEVLGHAIVAAVGI